MRYEPAAIPEGGTGCKDAEGISDPVLRATRVSIWQNDAWSVISVIKNCAPARLRRGGEDPHDVMTGQVLKEHTDEDERYGKGDRSCRSCSAIG